VSLPQGGPENARYGDCLLQCSKKGRLVGGRFAVVGGVVGESEVVVGVASRLSVEPRLATLVTAEGAGNLNFT
jgi:hypothetical protein